MKKILPVLIAIMVALSGAARKTLAEYKAEADGGSALAMYNIGALYSTGSGGVEKNLPEALRWFVRAAEKGDIHGIRAAAGYYQMGYGTEKNEEEAVRWWRKGADKNDAESLYRLACAYINGNGVTEDADAGMGYMKKSADNGDLQARLYLGRCMLRGSHNMPKDTLGAMEYLSYAARMLDNDKNDRAAQAAFDELRNLAATCHSDGMRWAVMWRLGETEYFLDLYCDAEKHLKESAELGGIDAAGMLGHLYVQIDRKPWFIDDKDGSAAREWEETLARYRECSVRGKDDTAAAWFEKALEYAPEWLDLYWQLFAVYHEGVGVEKDWTKAASALEYFAGHDGMWDGDEYNRLGDMYVEGGYGLKRDAAKALSMYRMSEEKYGEAPWSSGGIGKCYYYGNDGVPRDYAKAVSYLKKAEEESGEACRLLSACYRFGRGVPENVAKANEYLKKAETLNDEVARQINDVRGRM